MKWRRTLILALAVIALAAEAQSSPQGGFRRRQRPRPRRQRPREGNGLDCSTFDGGIDMCSYQSHREMLGRLHSLERRFPRVAQVGTIGKSVEGRELAFIKISGNVTRRSLLEPKFKYVANMHGDETLGRQLLLYLAEYLLQGYGRDARVTRIVDETEIFLMPTLNPDGFSRSKEGCENNNLFSSLLGGGGPSGRENANGKDLNRDFPQRLRFRGNTITRRDLFARRQTETNSMIRWILEGNFVLSANIHGGAVVASYPYDDNTSGRAVDSPSPDDRAFRYLASLYARGHRFMSGRGGRNVCVRGEEFPGGVTNGAEWYVVAGGMQDFNYVYSNALEITLELSCCKHVPSNTLVEEWLNNKEALLRYMEATHLGVKGLVADQDRRPIQGAEIVVEGEGKRIRTTDQGEYWRLLSPGTYSIFATAPGYSPSPRATVSVSDSPWPPRAQIKNFVLARA